jgi:hypothetical protein
MMSVYWMFFFDWWYIWKNRYVIRRREREKKPLNVYVFTIKVNVRLCPYVVWSSQCTVPYASSTNGQSQFDRFFFFLFSFSSSCFIIVNFQFLTTCWLNRSLQSHIPSTIIWYSKESLFLIMSRISCLMMMIISNYIVGYVSKFHTEFVFELISYSNSSSTNIIILISCFKMKSNQSISNDHAFLSFCCYCYYCCSNDQDTWRNWIENDKNFS